MSIQVIQPGALTTVQDEGRYGYLASGIGTAGVMDREAYHDALALAGCAEGSAVLEMTLFGASLRFGEDTVIALTGADMKAELDGTPVPRYETLKVRGGQTLTMGFAVSGCRAYLAVSGGFDVPVVMGSRSTDIKCRIGGLEGRALRAGDILEYGKVRKDPGIKRLTVPDFPAEVSVRAIPGPQDDSFTAAGVETFFSERYTVSADSDRMGIRLEGTEIESLNGTDIISDGIAEGAVQVTSAGKPIVLMADRQTTGGYAKIAVVISADLPMLAQLKPGDRVRFEKISVAEAQQQYTDRKNSLKRRISRLFLNKKRSGIWKEWI